MLQYVHFSQRESVDMLGQILGSANTSKYATGRDEYIAKITTSNFSMQCYLKMQDQGEDKRKERTGGRG